MTKAELESKHLAELHSLAADAGIPGYRMLPRQELIAKLLDKKPAAKSKPRGGRGAESGRRPRDRGRRPEPRRKREEPKPAQAPKETAASAPQEAAAPARPKRKRRRRRWGRRKKVRVHDLLLSGVPGGRTLVYAETREGCTTLLREVGAELSGGRGPDPIALLVDPSPEELADWRRDAPKAEIVAAGQARHADDAIAQAARRAESGEAVIVLIDSLSRLAEAFGGSADARELFDAGGAVAGTGSLTVVAAVER
jgi:Rho termination factor, N-terminal domain